MKSKFFIAIVIVSFLSSCKKDNTSSSSDLDTVQVASKDSAAGVPVASNPVQNVGINPEHGQPRHRCDIPVGAPLDASPANNVQPTSILPPSIQSNPVQTVPSGVSSSGALNPEHGQPGHRCDIPVGAPLG